MLSIWVTFVLRNLESEGEAEIFSKKLALGGEDLPSIGAISVHHSRTDSTEWVAATSTASSTRLFDFELIGHAKVQHRRSRIACMDPTGANDGGRTTTALIQHIYLNIVLLLHV